MQLPSGQTAMRAVLATTGQELWADLYSDAEAYQAAGTGDREPDEKARRQAQKGVEIQQRWIASNVLANQGLDARVLNEISTKTQQQNFEASLWNQPQAHARDILQQALSTFQQSPEFATLMNIYETRFKASQAE